MFLKRKKIDFFCIFHQTLEAHNFANNLWNFLKPRPRTFLKWGVPIMLPKISATLSVTNSGNNFKIEKIFFSKIKIF